MHMSVIQLTDSTFKKEITEYPGIAVIDFWAPWCGPCRMVGPVIEEIGEELDGKVKVCKVNVEEEGTLSNIFEIMSIPAVFVFKNGEIVEKMIGLQSKESYIETIQKHL